MDKFQQTALLLSENNIKYLCDEPMKKHTTFKIGGNAKLMAYAENIKQLSTLLEICKKYNVPYFILGNGSNILVSDKGIERLVICLDGDFKKIEKIDDDTLYCGAGATLPKLCNTALSYHLSGLEFAWGIPGTVGGAAFMNAGAYGGEMKDVVISCNHITPDGKTGKIMGDYLDFSYRNSVYKRNGYIITGITLKLKKGDQSKIREEMDDYMSRRKSKQPVELPSAGSVFKRPEGHFAGALVEQCGFKGFSVGDAQVSEKHCGFIVNKGSATADDVNKLIEKIKTTVFEKTGVSLEQEIINIGE